MSALPESRTAAADADPPTPAGKPALRGLLHAIAFPISAVAAVVLVCLAASPAARVTCAIYGVAIVQLFGVSAAYHRGHWSERTWWRLKRLDHADIYLAIAGTYTPICILLLHGAGEVAVLSVVWGGALAGVIMSVWWPSAPRPLLVPTYIVVGWTALFIIPQMLHRGGVAFLVLTLVGGVFYTCGGLVYALRRPNPSPRYFGFHEVFHSFTVVAYIVQYVAISIAAYRIAPG